MVYNNLFNQAQELLLTGKTSKPMTCCSSATTMKITDPPPILHGQTVALIETQQRGVPHIHILSTDLMTSPTEPHVVKHKKWSRLFSNFTLSPMTILNSLIGTTISLFIKFESRLYKLHGFHNQPIWSSDVLSTSLSVGTIGKTCRKQRLLK